MYGFAVNRVAALVVTLLLGVFAYAGCGIAQPMHRGGEQRFGGGGPGRYGPPAPGGRYAGPYGYAYRAGANPGYGVNPGYPSQPAYGPPPYPTPPPQRRFNSLGADWRPQQEEARSGVRHGQFAPLGRVIDSIQRRTPGRQLDSGIEYDGGRAIYRVRWITVHGRRIDFLVDAATGAILGER
jgi:hypothetical protein